MPMPLLLQTPMDMVADITNLPISITMPQESTPKFDEKILYKTHRHTIVPVLKSIQYSLWVILLSVLVYFISSYSWLWTISIGSIGIALVGYYQYYLWRHSWLFIGNQKVTLSVRNGIFSQFVMNVRYRNIRDCAVSKHSMWSFLFKYGTIFVRSSANEWDFHAEYVPKVWKVYALVNALSRYSDEERAELQSIEDLHNHHTRKESTHESWSTLHSKHH